MVETRPAIDGLDDPGTDDEDTVPSPRPSA